jgi:hypothetical protein
MIEALSSFETSVLTRATRRNIPEEAILRSHRRENLRSYITGLITKDLLLQNVVTLSTFYPFSVLGGRAFKSFEFYLLGFLLNPEDGAVYPAEILAVSEVQVFRNQEDIPLIFTEVKIYIPPPKEKQQNLHIYMLAVHFGEYVGAKQQVALFKYFVAPY